MSNSYSPQEYLHLIDPARPYSFTGAVIGLCGYQFPETSHRPGLGELLAELETAPLCPVCEVIAATVTGSINA